ncbi:unnamed protein product, partial [Polarella glacialis]
RWKQTSLRALSTAVALKALVAFFSSDSVVFSVPQQRRQWLLLTAASVGAVAPLVRPESAAAATSPPYDQLLNFPLQLMQGGGQFPGGPAPKVAAPVAERELSIEKVVNGITIEQISRPTSLALPVLYNLDLPVPEGKRWVDYSNPDPKEANLLLQGKFGVNKTSPVTSVAAGLFDRNLTLQEIRETNFTNGCGIISDKTSNGRVDLEWTFSERIEKVPGMGPSRLDKFVKFHNYARAIYGPTEDKDIWVQLQVEERQIEYAAILWPTLRDSFRPAGK